MRVSIVACLALLVVGACAQELSFTEGPKIVSVTPKDSGAIIGFTPPKQTSTTPEILEYELECSVPGEVEMGVAVFILEDLEDTSAELYGLENGFAYTCKMLARGATDGILPRAINSPYSNQSPLFTPSNGVSSTIFVTPAETEKPKAEKPKAEPTSTPSAVVPPTNPEDTKAVLPKSPSIKDTEVSANGDVKIIFSLPAGDETSPITGFIAACQNNGDSASSKQTMVQAGSTSALIPGLKPGEYTCSVAASTADGVGASSTKIVIVDSINETPVEKQDGAAQQKSAAVQPVLSFLGAAVFTVMALLFI